MADWATTRPWHHAGHRILQPFTKSGLPADTSWCLHCHEWGTGKRVGAYEGAVYAEKTYCGRCGRVIDFAVFDQAGDQATTQRAKRWATTPEEV